jgi:C_GCAxxG_C_C family probable redox protein
VTETTSLKAVYPLAGGALEGGSTCGVVSGGCLSISLGYLGDMVDGDAMKGEALYNRMREYTSWFEDRFGSTLCRERFGEDLDTMSSGFDLNVISGLMRCIDHTGKAPSHLVKLMERPLEEGDEVTEIDKRLSESGGYCASPVMRGIREATGHGSLYLEQLSMAFDGGVGLSGGLCGALAGALMPIGLIWGLQPRAAGLMETMQFTSKGREDLKSNPRKPGLWTVGNPLVSEFRDKYGSLECKDIVGRSFASGRELAEFVPGSAICSEIKDWCRDQAIECISAKTTL